MYDEFHIYFPDGKITLEQFMKAILKFSSTSSFKDHNLIAMYYLLFHFSSGEFNSQRRKTILPLVSSPVTTFTIITIITIITTPLMIMIITQEKKDIDTSMRLNSLLLKNDLLAESLFHVFDEVPDTCLYLVPGTCLYLVPGNCL